MLEVQAPSTPDGFVQRLSHERDILRIGPLEDRFQARLACVVEPQQTERLLRPDDPLGRKAHSEAAGVTQALGLREVCLASAQRLLGALSVLDVGGGSVPADDLSGSVVQGHLSTEEPTI